MHENTRASVGQAAPWSEFMLHMQVHVPEETYAFNNVTLCHMMLLKEACWTLLSLHRVARRRPCEEAEGQR